MIASNHTGCRIVGASSALQSAARNQTIEIPGLFGDGPIGMAGIAVAQRSRGPMRIRAALIHLQSGTKEVEP